MKLISHHLCPYVQRAVIVLEEKNIAHEREYIDLSKKPDWFLGLSPLGRVPVLQIDCAIIFESQVIVEFLDETSPESLHPADPLERARHRSWIEYGSATLNSIGVLYNAPNNQDFCDAVNRLRERFEVMEKEIHGPLFAGSSFCIIDAVWGPIFRYFDVLDPLLGEDIFEGLDAVTKWRQELSARPSVIKAVPDGYKCRLTTFLKNRNSYISTKLL